MDDLIADYRGRSLRFPRRVASGRQNSVQSIAMRAPRRGSALVAEISIGELRSLLKGSLRRIRLSWIAAEDYRNMIVRAGHGPGVVARGRAIYAYRGFTGRPSGGPVATQHCPVLRLDLPIVDLIVR